MTDKPIARVHVGDYDPEIHTGDDALIMAYAAASMYREDFPGAVVGVSYNTAAAESRERLILEHWGISKENA